MNHGRHVLFHSWLCAHFPIGPLGSDAPRALDGRDRAMAWYRASVQHFSGMFAINNRWAMTWQIYFECIESVGGGSPTFADNLNQGGGGGDSPTFSDIRRQREPRWWWGLHHACANVLRGP